jgi:transposase InsO family protein
MPWKPVSVMDEKMRFVAECLSGEEPMTILCERYNISRQTGYQLKRRYLSEGPSGLLERSRAPHHPGRVTPAELIAPILELRRAKPHWGPKKLLAILSERDPGAAWPSHSTVSELLRREGLSKPRRMRRRPLTMDQPFAAVQAANDAWCIDFKGWFKTADSARCDPFTCTDAFSRYLLGLQIMPLNTERVSALMDELFQEHGVPLSIRSDNGPPFASVGAGGLTRLSVHWAKMGVRLERIQPGKPQQNGRHERMHRTLKAEACEPPQADMDAQQAHFDAFRQEFNHERPHEALGQKPPASLYRPSPRRFVEPKDDPDYGEAEVRRVRGSGEIKWRNSMLFISEALIGEAVGLSQREDGHWLVCFNKVQRGFIDRNTGKIARFGAGRPPGAKATPKASPEVSAMSPG